LRLISVAAKPEIDTGQKEAYKNFVDICLTDFCYPRTHARL